MSLKYINIHGLSMHSGVRGGDKKNMSFNVCALKSCGNSWSAFEGVWAFENKVGY